MGEFAYNAHVHSTTGLAPFVAELGYLPRSVGDLVLSATNDTFQLEASFVEHQHAMLTSAQDAMATAQSLWHRYYDRNRLTISFAVNDKVLLDSNKSRCRSHGYRRKFAARFIGLYITEAITGPDRYRLKLPESLRLFPESHVSLLRVHRPAGNAFRPFV